MPAALAVTAPLPDLIRSGHLTGRWLLDTFIYVLDRVGPRDAFRVCAGLAGASGARYEDGPEPVLAFRSVKPGPVDGPWLIETPPGQGLHTLVRVKYRQDAPLHHPGERCPECSPEFCTSGGCLTPCWLRASFHTSYSWSGPHGATCGDLHARLIAGFGHWLDDQNAGWSWINEFVPGNMEGYNGLADLGKTGAEARRWLTGAVLPAVAAAQQNPGSARGSGHRLQPGGRNRN
jgi:hypothetical protein